jgi:CBS domain-containing membrane protein
MSQPWPLFGGQLVSVLIGVACAQWIPQMVIASALAVSGAIAAMRYLRCLHPPGGASALIAVVGGPQIHSLGFSYALVPVAINVLVMLLVSMVLYRVILHRPYPAKAVLENPDNAEPLRFTPPFSRSDLSDALSELGTVVDISEQDLATIYSLAMTRLHERQLSGLTCGAVMSTDVVKLEFATELEDTWRLFTQHRISGAPVVDVADRLIGIVTTSDLLRNADARDEPGYAHRIQNFIRRTEGHTSDKAEVAGQVMSQPVISVRESELLVSTLALFTKHSFHHLPVVNDADKLVGMLTRADLLKVMHENLPITQTAAAATS